MKNIIYLSVLVILIVISGTLLILYYTQEFDENISFKSSLFSEDITFSSSDGSNNFRAELGTLDLENKGIFTQVYNFPEIVGCVNFDENYKEFSNGNVRVYLDYSNDGIVLLKSENPLKIEVGKEASFKIMGVYNSYSEDFSWEELKKSVKSISLYKVSKKEPNPFDNSYYYGYSSGKECNSLNLNSKPIKEVPVIILN